MLSCKQLDKIVLNHQSDLTAQFSPVTRCKIVLANGCFSLTGVRFVYSKDYTYALSKMRGKIWFQDKGVNYETLSPIWSYVFIMQGFVYCVDIKWIVIGNFISHWKVDNLLAKL